jgi:hypothetical protein
VERLDVSEEHERRLAHARDSVFSDAHLHLEHDAVERRADRQPVDVGLDRLKPRLGLRNSGRGDGDAVPPVIELLHADRSPVGHARSERVLVLLASESLARASSTSAQRTAASARYERSSIRNRGSPRRAREPWLTYTAVMTPAMSVPIATFSVLASMIPAPATSLACALTGGGPGGSVASRRGCVRAIDAVASAKAMTAATGRINTFMTLLPIVARRDRETPPPRAARRS